MKWIFESLIVNTFINNKIKILFGIFVRGFVGNVISDFIKYSMLPTTARMCIAWISVLMSYGVSATPIIPLDTELPRSTSRGIVIEKTDRPEDHPPPLPGFDPGKPLPKIELPPVEKTPEDSAAPDTAARIVIRDVQLQGNTVFSDNELSGVIEEYLNRALTPEEIQAMRHQLTLHYVNRGYISSGIIIPEQDISEGTLTLRVVEGRLSAIAISGNTRLHEAYLATRIAMGAGPPVNMNELQQTLYLLEQNRLVERLQAEFKPGVALGEGMLNLHIEEARPYRFGIRVNNHRSPSVGEYRADIEADHYNVSGYGDRFHISHGLTEGLDDTHLSYQIPWMLTDTQLRLGYDKSDSIVVEAPFDTVDIESESESGSLSLLHPLVKTPWREFSLELKLERRRSETFLLGDRTSFSPGTDNGKSKISALRFSQHWFRRSQSQVLAARSRFSLGVNTMGATINESGPDGEFFAWLGQFQLAQRFKWLSSQLLARLDMQYTEEALLPIEQFAVGGAGSVRGYRENQLVRDKAWVLSLEHRIPLRTFKDTMSTDENLQFAVFYDYGLAWNESKPTPKPRNISSVGLGLRYDHAQRFYAELYWGHALRDVDGNDSNALQDDGVHFQLSLQVF